MKWQFRVQIATGKKMIPGIALGGPGSGMFRRAGEVRQASRSRAFQALALAVLVALAARPLTAAPTPPAAPDLPVSARITLPAPDIDPAPPLAPAFCPAPAALTTAGLPLGAVRAALRPGGHLEILAVGSGSILGPPPGEVFDSFPYRLAQALKGAAPGAEIVLSLYGGRGLTAASLAATLDQMLAARPAQLVLWQTGTIEALRQLPPPALAHALDEGAARVRASGAALILIDPPYSRFLRMHADLAPYEAVLRGAATLPGVMLFPRFDLMRGWAKGGGIDLERVGRAERRAEARRLQACLGRALAQQVLSGVALAAPAMGPRLGR